MSSGPATELAEGQNLAGKYLLVRRLGEGGMCHVFEAEHIHLRQSVALKVLKRELATDPDAVARFAREAQAAAKLRSPNVARVHDVDVLPDGQPYITMELLVGHDLGTELQNRGSLSIPLAVDYVRQAAAGIAEAHALGIVHRDLKPENLFLTDLGELTDRKLTKILDFGIAKNIAETARRLTAPDAVFGTVDYMSPEQIRSASTVDHRTDLWSLGIILYELLVGRTPFTGDARSVIAQIVSEPVPPPSRFASHLPPTLVAVVMRALHKDREQRYQSADDLRAALEPFAMQVEPITDVLGRLPPESMPRRAARTGDDVARNVRTNLSFEAVATKKTWSKRWVIGPLLVASLASVLAVVWHRADRLGLASYRARIQAFTHGNATATAPLPEPIPVAAVEPPSEPSSVPPPVASGDVPAEPSASVAAAPPVTKPRPRPRALLPRPAPPPSVTAAPSASSPPRPPKYL